MKFVKAQPLISFFILAYGIFWALWIPLIPYLQNLATFEIPTWSIPLALLGIYAPTFAAIIVTAISEGRAGLQKLFAPLFDWKLSFKWYLVAIFLPLSLAVIALLIHLGMLGELNQDTSFAWLSSVPIFLASIPIMLLVKLPLGPMAEELGWRGYALPRLQRKMSALNASLILGLLWGLWHLPAFWVPGAALGLEVTPSFFEIAKYVFNVTGVTIIFTWIYNNTRGSLIIDFLFHAAYNALPSLLFVSVDIFPELFTWVIWAFAILLIVIYGAENLAKEKVIKV
ncbi:MAG: CPBP family intramembrane metalloprotease [Anaerolineales bacterium]|nr:CPBP family intramembrane metalloprotease [Anaerolineales bacterium]